MMKRQQPSSPTLPATPIAPLDKEETASASSPSTTASPHGVRPLLSHLFGRGGGGGGFGVAKQQQQPVRVGSENETLRRNRRSVDHYLRRIGALMGRDVALDSRTGTAFFSHRRKFVVVVEVPDDRQGGGTVFVYTMVCRLDDDADERTRAAVLRRSMELNYLQWGTRGATLGLLDGQEINYCYSAQIARLTFADFRQAVETFLATAVDLHEELEAVKLREGGAMSAADSSSGHSNRQKNGYSFASKKGLM